MERTSFDSGSLPESARVPEWERQLLNIAVGTDKRRSGRGLTGRVEHFASAHGTTVSLLKAGPQRLSPQPGRHDGAIWLCLVMEGHASIETEGERSLLRPGDMLYGRRGASGELDIYTCFRLLNVSFPTERLVHRVFLPLPDRVVHLRGNTGLNPALGGMLAGLASTFDDLDEARIFTVESALLQLLVSAFFDDAREPLLGGHATAHAATLRRIWHSIETQLGDPQLNIGRIAREHRLSVRAVQTLFERNSQSFRVYVRQRRLENCRRELADNVNANVSITSICLHWGFGDSASFSRAFRAAYGTSPSAFRRNRLAVAEASTRVRKRLAKRRPLLRSARSMSRDAESGQSGDLR